MSKENRSTIRDVKRIRFLSVIQVILRLFREYIFLTSFYKSLVYGGYIYKKDSVTVYDLDVHLQIMKVALIIGLIGLAINFVTNKKYSFYPSVNRVDKGKIGKFSGFLLVPLYKVSVIKPIVYVRIVMILSMFVSSLSALMGNMNIETVSFIGPIKLLIIYTAVYFTEQSIQYKIGERIRSLFIKYLDPTNGLLVNDEEIKQEFKDNFKIKKVKRVDSLISAHYTYGTYHNQKHVYYMNYYLKDNRFKTTVPIRLYTNEEGSRYYKYPIAFIHTKKGTYSEKLKK